MATQQVNGSAVTPTSTMNNGGSVLNGGSTVVLNSVNLGYSSVGVFGSVVVDNNSTDKALNAGTFAFNNQRPVAKRLTKKISNVNNTILLSGASRPELVRNVHKLEKVTTRRLTTAIRANKYNRYTGSWDAGYPAVVVDPFYDIASQTTSPTSTDEAANPTMDVPGELVYKTGASVPVQDKYKAKTN